MRLFCLGVRHTSRRLTKKLSGIWIDTPLERKYNVKYLDVLFDEKMRWNV